MSQRVSNPYIVQSVRRARPTGGSGEDAPPEITERFEGREFELHELEARGVRIAGGHAVYTSLGQDWELELASPIS